MARRIKSLHHNLGYGKNIPFHREHRSKRGRVKLKETSIHFLRSKLKRKYGPDADLFDI